MAFEVPFSKLMVFLLEARIGLVSAFINGMRILYARDFFFFFVNRTSGDWGKN